MCHGSGNRAAMMSSYEGRCDEEVLIEDCTTLTIEYQYPPKS